MALNRLIPINLRIPENLVSESDRLAEQEGSNRSELMRNALRSYIERKQRLQTAFGIVERRGKAAGINTQADVERVLAQVKSKRRT
ncbi:MAG: ribbon-helix-helix domain-containing protein [bacterium]|nr:ribbon-helix-helix domain-containing protein [bacterium]